MVKNEISRDEFFNKASPSIKQKVEASFIKGELLFNNRGNVMEIVIAGVRGCHYEIGFHRDCHEIALHFQGTPQNNLSRSEGFRSYLPRIEVDLGHTIILGPHERAGRRRLWIKLPQRPITEELVEIYSDLTSRLIIQTYPILKSILSEEQRSRW